MFKKIAIIILLASTIFTHTTEQFLEQEEKALISIGALEQYLEIESQEIIDNNEYTLTTFDQFAHTLAEYLAEHGKIVRQSGGITNWYQSTLYIGSKNDISCPITPIAYPALLALCEQACQKILWAQNMTISVQVEENEIIHREQLPLTQIVHGLKMVPLPKSYYADAVTFLKTAAAVALISAGGYLAYKSLNFSGENSNFRENTDTNLSNFTTNNSNLENKLIFHEETNSSDQNNHINTSSSTSLQQKDDKDVIPATTIFDNSSLQHSTTTTIANPNLDNLSPVATPSEQNSSTTNPISTPTDLTDEISNGPSFLNRWYNNASSGMDTGANIGNSIGSTVGKYSGVAVGAGVGMGAGTVLGGAVGLGVAIPVIQGALEGAKSATGRGRAAMMAAAAAGAAKGGAQFTGKAKGAYQEIKATIKPTVQDIGNSANKGGQEGLNNFITSNQLKFGPDIAKVQTHGKQFSEDFSQLTKDGTTILKQSHSVAADITKMGGEAIIGNMIGSRGGAIAGGTVGGIIGGPAAVPIGMVAGDALGSIGGFIAPSGTLSSIIRGFKEGVQGAKGKGIQEMYQQGMKQATQSVKNHTTDLTNKTLDPITKTKDSVKHLEELIENLKNNGSIVKTSTKNIIKNGAETAGKTIAGAYIGTGIGAVTGGMVGSEAGNALGGGIGSIAGGIVGGATGIATGPIVATYGTITD